MARIEQERAMVECRTFGHAWERFTDPEKRRPAFGWRESVRCIRGCGTARHDTIDANGDVAERHYDYDAAYKYAADTLPSRAEFRVILHKMDTRESRRRVAAG